MNRLTFYAHPKCSTCEAARTWLQDNRVAFVEKDIRTTPPSVAELRTMLRAREGRLSRISNTSGLEYRAQGLSARLPKLSEEEALGVLAGNGMFVKRPFLVGADAALVGFDEKAWAAALDRA